MYPYSTVIFLRSIVAFHAEFSRMYSMKIKEQCHPISYDFFLLKKSNPLSNRLTDSNGFAHNFDFSDILQDICKKGPRAD